MLPFVWLEQMPTRPDDPVPSSLCEEESRTLDDFLRKVSPLLQEDALLAERRAPAVDRHAPPSLAQADPPPARHTKPAANPRHKDLVILQPPTQNCAVSEPNCS
jgi:hypothetical protein